MKCEWCNEKFNASDAEDYFIGNTFGLSYANFTKCLCGKCAVEAIEEKVEDVYFETCERCGKEFDLILEEEDFASHYTPESVGLTDVWHNEILCSDCAQDYLDEVTNQE